LCACDKAFSTPDPFSCSERNSPVKNGENMTGTVLHDFWNFYHIIVTQDDIIDGSNSVFLELYMNRDSEGSTGDFTVYVRNQAKPTKDQYDFISNTDSHTNLLKIPTFPNFTWWIAIDSDSDIGSMYNIQLKFLPTITTPSRRASPSLRAHNTTGTASNGGDHKWPALLGVGLGAAAGGAGLLVLFLLALFVYRYRKRKNSLQFEPLSLDEPDDDSALPKL